MKDAVATMGNTLPDDAGGRDAVHVAVFSAIAKHALFPAQPVSIVTHGERDVEVSRDGDHVGIVDPFLATAANIGERVWIYLYPRTITGLSHKWSHPAFDGAGTTYAPPSAKLASEEWLRDFIATADCPGYETVMAAAADVADGDNKSWNSEYLHFDGLDAHGEIPNEFWDHVAVVLGRPIRGPRPNYFSCSC